MSAAMGPSRNSRSRHRCGRASSARRRGASREIGDAISPVTTRSWLPASDRSHRSRERHALVRLGTVADQVAEAPDAVGRERLHVVEHRPEGRQVAVHVRDQGDPHGAFYSVAGMKRYRSAVDFLAARTRRPHAFAVTNPKRSAAAGARRRGCGSRGCHHPVPTARRIHRAGRRKRASYFSAAQLERAADFRDPQRLLGLAGLAVSGGTLALLALRPPRRLLDPWRGDPSRRRRRRRRHIAAAGRGWAAARHRQPPARLRRRPLHPDLRAMAGRRCKAAAVEAAFAAVGAALTLALVRRFSCCGCRPPLAWSPSAW